LAWDGNESNDEIFYTPTQSPVKEEFSSSGESSGQTHLEVNGYVHFVIVKQPLELENINHPSK
jgi:hypothetical protein